jgi:hypothetical protein
MKKMAHFKSFVVTIAFIFLFFFIFPFPVFSGESTKKKTHLNVKVNELVSLETFVVPNDNSGDSLFYYDRQSSSPFTIPTGYSFVVTDIIMDPETVGVDDNKFYLVLVETDITVRKFTARFKGTDTRHYTLTGGLVFPEEYEPTARNTTFSSTGINVQILGYFVKGKGLNPGQPRF